MNGIIRSTLTILATVAATAAGVAVPGTASAAPGDTVYIGGVAYTDRGTFVIGDGIDANDVSTDPVGAALDVVLDAAKPVSCVPKSTSTTIHQPYAHVYYGALDSIYVWEGLAEAEIEGCPENTVTVRVRLRDQALDGASPAVEGPEATGTGKQRAGAVADLTQRYSNVAMATGMSLHALTMTAIATQTDGRTTTTWCTTKTWTYIATVAGPRFVGETPTERVKCGT